MKVSVVIPTFNRLDGLGMVLDALERQTISGFEVIIVDNSSTDGTEAAMTERAGPGPVFELVYQRKEPEGPAAARNLGSSLSRAPFVAFVDSDVELAPDWLDLALTAMAEDPKLGAVGGQVLYANDPGYLNSFGGALSRIGFAWDRLEGQPETSGDAVTDVLWMNCSAALMRKDALAAIGGFDDRYFYAYEDSDVGWRLSIAGWRQAVLPAAKVRHHVGDEIAPSSDTIVFHLTKNRLASLLSNGGLGLLALHLPIHLGFTLADSALRRGRRARLRGLWWNLMNLGQTMARRRMIQSQRMVADRDLLFAPRLFPSEPLGGFRRRPNRAQRVLSASESPQDDRV